MIAKEDAIDKALAYAMSKLGISGNSSTAQADIQTGSWNIAINGEQEEDLILVPVKLTVQVYKDAGGDAKCRLLMAPVKSEGVQLKLINQDWFPTDVPVNNQKEEIAEDVFSVNSLPY